MNECSTISYFRSTDLDRIDRAVAALCRAEGYALARKPPPPLSRARFDAMRYGPGEDSPLWAFALVPGNGEWTMLMTAPIELLAERGPDTNRPRLADLAVLAGCDTFTYNVYGELSTVVMEANARGETNCSGFLENDEDRHHAEMIDVWDTIGFMLVGVPTPIHRAVTLGPEAIGELVTGDLYNDGFELDGQHTQRWWLWYNGVPEELLRHREVPVPGARTRYFRASR